MGYGPIQKCEVFTARGLDSGEGGASAPIQPGRVCATRGLDIKEVGVFSFQTMYEHIAQARRQCWGNCSMMLDHLG